MTQIKWHLLLNSNKEFPAAFVKAADSAKTVYELLAYLIRRCCALPQRSSSRATAAQSMLFQLITYSKFHIIILIHVNCQNIAHFYPRSEAIEKLFYNLLQLGIVYNKRPFSVAYSGIRVRGNNKTGPYWTLFLEIPSLVTLIG